MSKTKKKILFYTLFIAFFVVGYFALLFAFGYAYDFDSGKFVKTGSIYVSATTSAKVKIGDGKAKDTGLLRNDSSKKYLTPDNYDVEISKQGYHGWYKNVEVPAGLVASFQNIVLVPMDLKAITLLPTIQNLSVSSDGQNLFYRDTANKYGMVDLKDPKIQPSEEKINIALNIVSWDKEGKNVFFSNYATSRIVGETNKIIPTPTRLLNPTLTLTDGYLVSLSNNEILVYNHDQGVLEETIENASSFSVYDNSIYYINSEDYLLYEFDLNNKSNVLVSGANNFKGGSISKVEELDGDLYVSIKAISTNHLFRVNAEEITLIAQNISDFMTSYDNEKLVWWSKFGVWVCWVNDTKIQPFKKAGESERIFAGNTINTVYWHKHSNYLVIFSDRNIVFSETDTRSETNRTTLFDALRDSKTGLVQVIKNGVYNADSDNIYFQIGTELKRISLEK